MSELLVFLLILVLAVVLIAGGLFLSRRSARTEAPPVAPPAAPTPRPPEAPPQPTEPEVVEPAVEAPEPDVEVAAPVRERPRLRDRLGKTRAAFAGAVTRRGKIDPETWDELEEALLLADVGMPTTQRILEDVKARRRGGEGLGLRRSALAAESGARVCCSSRGTAASRWLRAS